MQTITISTHVPFHDKGMQHLFFVEDMPETLRKYLNCVHYTDSCIENFYSFLKEKDLLKDATIIITGDHTIFKKSMLQEFQSFAEQYNYTIPKEESFCPLIIISPNIKERIEVGEMCYQMDIFPTIMHCIGVDDYPWKGFGVNLLDSIARKNRCITEEEAYILSDKMIRSNYFKNFCIKYGPQIKSYQLSCPTKCL